MRQIVSDVYLLEGLRGANAYVLVSGEELTLVDCGLAADVERIIVQLRGAGYSLSQLRNILLTHAHIDHIGGAATLTGRAGARVFAHRDEVPYVEGDKSLPAASPLMRIMNWLGDRLVSKLPSCQVSRPLEDGETIEILGGAQVVHTPGHTPGSICLYQPEHRILFSGDALFNANPMTRKPGLRLPLRFVSHDNAQAFESVTKLSRLEIEVLCPGHGEPILEGAGEKISALLREKHSD